MIFIAALCAIEMDAIFFKCSFVAVIQLSYYFIRNPKLAYVSPVGTIKQWKEKGNEFEHRVSRENKSSAPTMDTAETRDEIKSFNIEI